MIDVGHTCGGPSSDPSIAPIVKRCGSSAYPWRVVAAEIPEPDCWAGSWKLKREAIDALARNGDGWLSHAWSCAEMLGVVCTDPTIDRCAWPDRFVTCDEPICPPWQCAAGKLAEIWLMRLGWSGERVRGAWRGMIWEPDRELLYKMLSDARKALDAGIDDEDAAALGATESTRGYLRLDEFRREALGRWLDRNAVRMQEPERQCKAAIVQ